MEHNEIVDALLRLKPGANWNLIGDDYSKIEWLDDVKTKPTAAQIQAEIDNPTPAAALSINDKLSATGLSLDELKSALGL
jgi:hypothetical protein